MVAFALLLPLIGACGSDEGDNSADDHHCKNYRIVLSEALSQETRESFVEAMWTWWKLSGAIETFSIETSADTLGLVSTMCRVEVTVANSPLPDDVDGFTSWRYFDSSQKPSCGTIWFRPAHGPWVPLHETGHLMGLHTHDQGESVMSKEADSPVIRQTHVETLRAIWSAQAPKY